jgi:hypothetical protein
LVGGSRRQELPTGDGYGRRYAEGQRSNNKEPTDKYERASSHCFGLYSSDRVVAIPPGLV